jgi:hypothetical protein
VITFQLDQPDGTHVERTLHAPGDFAFAADHCDVRVGANTFQVTVERIGSDPAPETVTAPALWELMYFGKTIA